MPNHKPAVDIPLVPFSTFKKAARTALAHSKEESDREIVKLQAANLRKREAKKKR